MSDAIAREIMESYREFDEDRRLDDPYGVLQRRHTEEILARYLPRAGMDVLDVGGATGAYAFRLAEQGHRVHLVDLTPKHIELARQRNTGAHRLESCVVADARELPFADGCADAVILHGPLYHLVERRERDRVWAEARRVLRPGGVVFGFGIGRFAGLIYGLAEGKVFDEAYWSVVSEEVKTGVRNNNPPRIRSLLRAYFHRPEELAAELETAGFRLERTIGVVGPAWLVRDAARCVTDAAQLARLLEIARLTESDPVLSSGVVCVGYR
jgi:ubiquinone/menaquinone biosynthesis C-methylase UbiE